MVKHLAEKRQDKSHSNTVTQPARWDRGALVLNVDASFEVSFRNQVSWITFGDRHAGPDFRDQQTDIVVDSEMRADITSGGHENGVTRQKVGYQGSVEIDDRWQGVERPFRERAFRASSRRGRGLTSYAADKFHKKLGH